MNDEFTCLRCVLVYFHLPLAMKKATQRREVAKTQEDVSGTSHPVSQIYFPSASLPPLRPRAFASLRFTLPPVHRRPFTEIRARCASE